MNDKEILEKAIQRAINNGFYSFADGIFGNTEFVVICGNNPTQDLFGGGFRVYVKDWPPEEAISIERILFDHDFARALWGDEELYLYAQPGKPGDYRNEQPIEEWKRHLIGMVIAPDPIKYLGENMGEQLSKESEGETT